MAFHDVVFPVDIRFGSVGGPGFNSFIYTNHTGIEQRLTRWSQPKRSYSLAYLGNAKSDIYSFLEFYYARQGALHSFKYKDWRDYTTGADGIGAVAYDDFQIGTGDGIEKDFQLSKIYNPLGQSFTSNITKPVTGTTVVGIDGVSQGSGWTVNTSTGVVSFVTAPGSGLAVTAGCQFYVHTRFSDDIDKGLGIESIDNELFQLPQITLNEVKEVAPVHSEFNYRGAQYLSLTGDYQLTATDGIFYNIDSDSVANKVKLPDETNLPTGGPYFFLRSNTPNFDLRDFNDNVIKNPTVNTVTYMLNLGLNSSLVKTWYLTQLL